MTVPAATPYDADWRLAKRLADTEFVPVAMRGRPEAVLGCILMADALHIHPYVALAQVAIINGRPTMSSELMRALVKRAGHTLIAETRTAERATITGVRADDKTVLQVTWTLEDAANADLLKLDKNGRPVALTNSGKPLPWQAYTRVMLYARATAELCRAHFADVLAGIPADQHITTEELYIPGEHEELGGLDLGEVGDAADTVAAAAPPLPPPSAVLPGDPDPDVDLDAAALPVEVVYGPGEEPFE
jgi:hypothetical protein